MASENVELISNKQVICKEGVTGLPKESDMYIATSTMSLNVPQGVKAVLVENLYLSLDPYMRGVSNKDPDRLFHTLFLVLCSWLWSGQISGFKCPEFKEAVLVWGANKMGRVESSYCP